MKTYSMTKEKWISLFQSIGLNDEQMRNWHQQFENTYPDEHQAFLEWLQIAADEIKVIRDNRKQ